MIRLIVVDDQFIVREGLKLFFAEDAQVRVVAEATNGQGAIELAAHLRPDVILTELKLPGLDGVTLTRHILAQQPKTKIIIYTITIDPSQVIDLVSEGVMGYILKDTPPQQLIGMVKDVSAGYPQFDPKILDIILKHRKQSEQISRSLRLLTRRERQIIHGVVAGQTYADIGKQLLVSESTVKFHISHILQKLHLTNRVQLAAYATQNLKFDTETPKSD